MTTPKGFKLLDDKKLIQTAENLDDKKWLVNRFEVQMENMIREITTVRETFNSYATKAETEFKELRSISLAVVAIAAALILGISYDQIGITYPNIIIAIVVVIIAGIGSFILLTFLKKKAHSIVMEVDLAFLSALDKLNFLIGHYIEVSVDIQEIDIDRLGFFINYGWFAGIISRLEQKDAYDKVYKSVLFRGLRSQIEEPVKLGKAQMDFGVEFYKTFEQEFHRYKEDFLGLGFVHNAFLSRFKIVYPNPKIEASSS